MLLISVSVRRKEQRSSTLCTDGVPESRTQVCGITFPFLENKRTHLVFFSFLFFANSWLSFFNFPQRASNCAVGRGRSRSCQVFEQVTFIHSINQNTRSLLYTCDAFPPVFVFPQIERLPVHCGQICSHEGGPRWKDLQKDLSDHIYMKQNLKL